MEVLYILGIPRVQFAMEKWMNLDEHGWTEHGPLTSMIYIDWAIKNKWFWWIFQGKLAIYRVFAWFTS